MNSCELVTFVPSVACFLAQSCSREELSILAALFVQLGETLDMILVHEEICGSKKD